MIPYERTANKSQILPISFQIFCIWAFILVGRPQDYFTFLAPFRIALVFTALTVVTTLGGNGRFGISTFGENQLNKKYLILYLIMWVGLPFADHRGVTFKYLYRFYIMNMIFFYFFYTYTIDFKKLKKLLFLMCSSGLIYGIFLLLKGVSGGGRHMVGTMFDPNDLAYFVVSLMPLSLLFVQKNETKLRKILAYGNLMVSPVTVLLTGSRGGFLALLAVMLIIFMKKIEGITKTHKMVFIVIGFLAVGYYAQQIDMTRFSTMLDLEDDYNLTSDTGRIEVWKTGLELIARNPVFGVGVGNFGRSFGYLRESKGMVPVWKTAHNSFIQIGAEVGIVGLLIYLSMILYTLKYLKRVANIKAKTDKQHQLKNLSIIVMAGFIGNLVGAFFLSQAYSVIFTLYFAITASIQYLIEKEDAIESEKEQA